MDQQNRRAELARRLSEANAAHAEYEQQVLNGVYDQQWAEWYAHYLVTHGWNKGLERAWEESALAAALRAAEAAHRANAPDRPWQEYYAEYLNAASAAP